MSENKEVYIILDDIKYAQNIGSIFRLADAFKIKKIFLCRNKFEKLNYCQERILYKASRGATEWVDWEYRNSCKEVVQELKSLGVQIVGIETGEDSEFIDKVEFKYPLGLVFGSEDDGISEEIMGLCDKLAKIPMQGRGKSLNVSTSVSIAVYEAFRSGNN